MNLTGSPITANAVSPVAFEHDPFIILTNVTLLIPLSFVYYVYSQFSPLLENKHNEPSLSHPYVE